MNRSESQGNLDKASKQAPQFTGVSNIPNQVHYLHSKRKVHVNVMLFGETGMGKTGFINHVLGQQMITDEQQPNTNKATASDSVVDIRIRRQEIEESGTAAQLSIIDFPQFGLQAGKKETGKAALAFIEDQFEAHLREESKHRRNRSSHDASDSRVHAVLYFHNPTAHKLSQLDVDLIKKMSVLANVLIVVAKGDTLLRHEFHRIRSNIRGQLENVRLFSSPENNASSADPFIVVNGADMSTVSPARNYFWGTIKVTPNASAASSLNFNVLIQLLFKNFLPDLILNTQSKYEEWKSAVIRRMNVSEDEWKEPAEVLNKLVARLSELKMNA
jgi:septin family protein